MNTTCGVHIWCSHVAVIYGVHIWCSHVICRCHDMWKQQYATKSHSKAAWRPLEEWLFRRKSSTESRVARLTGFNKDDIDLHNIVAKCELRLAHGANHPWGVAALKPRGYSAVPETNKVCRAEYSRGFFFLHFHLIGSHVNIPCHDRSDAIHMCTSTGLVLCDWCASLPEQGALHEHGELR